MPTEFSSRLKHQAAHAVGELDHFAGHRRLTGRTQRAMPSPTSITRPTSVVWICPAKVFNFLLEN